MITMNEIFQSIISKVKNLLNNYQQSTIVKPEEKNVSNKPISTSELEATTAPKTTQTKASESPAKASTKTPEETAAIAQAKVSIEPAVKPKPVTQDQKAAPNNIPEDSMLKRHYLSNLSRASETQKNKEKPLENKASGSKKNSSIKSNVRIDANIPTDSVLYRHYETMINAELNSLLDNK